MDSARKKSNKKTKRNKDRIVELSLRAYRKESCGILASDAGNAPDRLLLLSLLHAAKKNTQLEKTSETQLADQSRTAGAAMFRDGGKEKVYVWGGSQVSQRGQAPQRVGHAAGEAVAGEVQRLQPGQRAQLRRQTARDVVVLQQPGLELHKRKTHNYHHQQTALALRQTTQDGEMTVND
jgi:hypothetical protein